MFNKALAELAAEDQRILYRNNARQLADLAPRVLHHPEVISGDSADPAKYEQVGAQLFQTFTEEAGDIKFHSGGIRHGFNVCARLAMWGAWTYRGHIVETAAPASVSELSDILQASYNSAVSPFSGVSHKVNRPLELAFGLLSNRETAYEALPYVIRPTAVDDEQLVLKPSPYSLMLLQSDPELSAAKEQTSLTERCPAAGILLKKVWAQTVASCAISPHLFPADVAEINESRESAA